jgi:predicted phage baseplate assembly protein
MSTPIDAPRLDPCGCCEAGVPQRTLYNRSGLPALDYRIGTHPIFLRRGLARLPSQPVPADDPHGARPLSRLTTRSADDPTIALLDTWATVADVLTFYQERIANEGFLRTATERSSVLELARAIGYELNPGVAASTFLAFTVEGAPGSPGVATVPLGTKVQSVPDQGTLPQTFETSAQITARAEWNALRPRPERPQELGIRRNSLYMLGLSTGFAPGASETIPASEVYPLDPPTLASMPTSGRVQAVKANQIYLKGTNTGLQAGGVLLVVGKRGAGAVRTLVLPIGRIEPEPESNRTRVVLQEGAMGKPPPVFTPVFSKLATVKLGELPLDRESVKLTIRDQSWRERDLAAFLSIQSWSGRSLVEHINSASEPSPSRLPQTDAGAFAFRERLGIFGHNAPRRESLPPAGGEPVLMRGDAYPYDWDTNGWSIWKDPNKDSAADGYYMEADVYLERSLPGVVDGGWVVLERPTKRYAPYRVETTSEASLAGFALSARATGLRLSKVDGSTLRNSTTDKPEDYKVRLTTAHVQSERLDLAQVPIENPVDEGSISLQLDRMVLGLQAGQPLVLTGERQDLTGVTATEIVVLADVRHSGGYTTLFFREGLQHPYVRNTLVLNANVTLATHGETVVEVLGSGDGTRPNQRFTLKKPPLTYVAAANARGSQSTLKVQVSGVYWREAPQLYTLDERSKNYIIRMEDDGETHVVFGDGIRGASLPTGAENVTATYRSGIGLSGMVGADKLTLLQTRPLGIRGVSNPVPASGADEPESRDSARANAPLAVITLDRVVSLQDFEDFSRTFAGVGKAKAVMLWKDGTRLVHITIAAVAPTTTPDTEGARSALATNVVERSSALYTNLVETIRGASDSAQQFQIDSYQPLFFNVKAKVLIDPAYTPAAVLTAVETALKDTFTFEKRDFGQPVTAAEVVTVIQGVTGVVATDLDHLYRYRDQELPPDPEEQVIREVLEAGQVHLTDDGIELTQLLLLNPVGITLEEMTP